MVRCCGLFPPHKAQVCKAVDMNLILILALVSLCWAALPVVDLGYELHRANALSVGFDSLKISEESTS